MENKEQKKEEQNRENKNNIGEFQILDIILQACDITI